MLIKCARKATVKINFGLFPYNDAFLCHQHKITSRFFTAQLGITYQISKIIFRNRWLTCTVIIGARFAH